MTLPRGQLLTKCPDLGAQGAWPCETRAEVPSLGSLPPHGECLGALLWSWGLGVDPFLEFSEQVGDDLHASFAPPGSVHLLSGMGHGWELGVLSGMRLMNIHACTPTQRPGSYLHLQVCGTEWAAQSQWLESSRSSCWAFSPSALASFHLHQCKECGRRRPGARK